MWRWNRNVFMTLFNWVRAGILLHQLSCNLPPLSLCVSQTLCTGLFTQYRIFYLHNFKVPWFPPPVTSCWNTGQMFNRFDTTPNLMSPPTISAPIHTAAGDSFLPIQNMASSPSLSAPTTSDGSPSSPSRSPLPNTNKSMDGVASHRPPNSMTGRPPLDFHNSLPPTPSPSPTFTPSEAERELSDSRGPVNISPREVSLSDMF